MVVQIVLTGFDISLFSGECHFNMAITACYASTYMTVKLAQSIGRSIWVREVSSSSPAVAMLSGKLNVLEIILYKALTVNFFVETRPKIEELIPAAMVDNGLYRVQLPLWL